MKSIENYSIGEKISIQTTFDHIYGKVLRDGKIIAIHKHGWKTHVGEVIRARFPSVRTYSKEKGRIEYVDMTVAVRPWHLED